MFYNNDIPKYRKKKASRRKSKSNHKHEYSSCIGRMKRGEDYMYLSAEHCEICGKTRVNWRDSFLNMFSNTEDILRANQDLKIKDL